MKNGLYKVEFATPLGAGFGVVYAQDGVMRGGDSAIYYLGNYAVNDNKVTATVITDRHANYPGVMSVFGRDRVHIHLEGTADGDSLVCRGTSPDAPGVSFQAKLSRIAD